MGTSPEAFNQVREILRKLDRSIDNARDRRLAGSPDDDRTDPARTHSDAPQPHQTPGGPLRARPMSPRPESPPADRPLRAKPLRRPTPTRWDEDQRAR